MPLSYIGNSGKKYTLIEPALGKGGEGAIYRISNLTGSVIKVFRDDKRTEARKRKLLAMIATPLSDEAMNQVTWPTDVVYDNGQFVGYVMPEISNNEDLNVMYSDKYTCTFTEKITIARNLCAAINAVHNAGQVCGDLNPKNIGVDPRNARVTLVDTDSYHISEKGGGRVYRCEVGMPEYLPREIQEKMKNGYRLDNAPLPTFTQETDLFALAVHIFALLMNGCHPFACAVDLALKQPSVAAPQPIDNICTGIFPFYQKQNGIVIPPYAPDFDMLPSYMQELFIRAFVDGHASPRRRPDAVEWYDALLKLEKNILTCRVNKKHLYPSHLNKCPWCELDKRVQQTIKTQQNIPMPARIQQVSIGMQARAATNVSVTSPNRAGGLFATEKMFWFLTIMIPLAIQVAVHFLSGNFIVGEVFGREYGDGIEYWGVNIAIWAGPWGFMICGLIGTYLYNTLWSKGGKKYGYEWYHYVLSIVVSFLAAAAWILVIFLLTIAIMIIAAIFIIAILISMFSGS